VDSKEIELVFRFLGDKRLGIFFRVQNRVFGKKVNAFFAYPER
jgi:hypothetical protein